jgi:hypothetical protein
MKNDHWAILEDTRTSASGSQYVCRLNSGKGYIRADPSRIMMTDRIVNIKESYISEWASPKDPIVVWVKWDGSPNFDHISLKYEADVFVYRILNVHEKVFEQNLHTGKVIIPKEDLGVPGFFGFHGICTEVPISERKIEFIIEFIHNGNAVHTERKVTNIIRPMLKLAISPQDIMVSDNTAALTEQIQFRLVNLGSAGIKEANITFNPFSSTDLKVEISPKKETDNPYDDLIGEPQEKTVNTLTLKGKGHAIIKIDAEYTDYKGIQYKDNIGSITIDIRQNVNQKIPINRSSEYQLPALLAA